MKTILAASACAFLLTARAASASPVTYNISQPFWGSHPGALHTTLSTTAWQTQRQNSVAADPGGFNYLNGWVTLDWDTYSVLDYAFDVDFTISGVGSVAQFASSDPGNTYFGGYNSTGNSDWISIVMTTSWGPLVERAGVTDELYTADLQFNIYHFLSTDELTLLLNGISAGVFVEMPGFCSPYGFCGSPTGQYDYGAASGNPMTATYGGGQGIALASPVPIPAAIWFLFSGMAIFGFAGRRRNSLSTWLTKPAS